MNKLLLAALAGLLSVNAVEARLFGRNNGNCCPTTSCERPCATSCAKAVTPPRCCKTIEVPQTIMVKKTIEIPAEEVRTPNPDRIIRHPQPCEEVRVPLPQQYRIEYKQVPDEIEVVKVPDTISYRCPADCNTTTVSSRSCSTRSNCATRCCK